MRNKWLILLAVLVGAALAAGIAYAAKSGGVTAASATFNATTVTKNATKTCTITGGDTYTFTHATYTGTAASSDARLTGPMVVRAQSILDQTTGVGALIGTFKVDGAKNAGAHGKIEAALSGGQLSGYVRSHLDGPAGELFAGLNGGFTSAGGFTNASVGTGDSPDSGVVLSHGACVKNIPLDF